MESTALSDVHVGREMFRIFNNLFALETDQSEWTMPGDTPLVAGLLGDQGILKEGFRG